MLRIIGGQNAVFIWFPVLISVEKVIRFFVDELIIVRRRFNITIPNAIIRQTIIEL